MTPNDSAGSAGLEVAFTPGPWQVMHDFDREGRTTIIGNVDGEIHPSGPTYSYEFVATTADPNDDITGRHTEIANARLIAAAPDLVRDLQSAWAVLSLILENGWVPEQHRGPVEQCRDNAAAALYRVGKSS